MVRTRETVYVVEDDESVRKALRRLIRSAGLDVTAFASAEEFLHAAGQPAPACLVLDLHLPGLSGLELHERLRAEGRSTPAVFITAYGDDQARERAFRGGAVAFLPKPFDDRSLLDAVAQALDAGRAG